MGLISSVVTRFGITSPSLGKTSGRITQSNAWFANGLLNGEMVVMVYSERPHGTHVISLRKAEKHEARYYRKVAKENLGQG